MKVLVLTGRILPGFYEQQTWAKVAALFRLDPEEFDMRILARLPLMIRETIEIEELQKLRATLQSAGAETEQVDADGKWFLRQGSRIAGPVPLAYLKNGHRIARFAGDVQVRRAIDKKWMSLVAAVNEPAITFDIPPELKQESTSEIPSESKQAAAPAPQIEATAETDSINEESLPLPLPLREPAVRFKPHPEPVSNPQPPRETLRGLVSRNSRQIKSACYEAGQKLGRMRIFSRATAKLQTATVDKIKTASNRSLLIAAGVVACFIAAIAIYRISAQRAIPINNVSQLEAACSKTTGSNLVDLTDQRLVSCIQKFAERGNAFTQNIIGDCHDTGRCAGIEKDEAQAAAWYRKAAEQGNADGQVNLGVAYARGKGVDKDEAQAVTWYRKAAEQGNASGQAWLGGAYWFGWGVDKDQAQAIAWLRKAAEQGNAYGQARLGAAYASGAGVDKDEAQAVAWYRKAAEQGNVYGQARLGIAYASGTGVDKDEAQAITWYRTAAEQGDAESQVQLGVAYAEGRGINKDEAQAVTWYRKAAEQGYAEGQVDLGIAYVRGEGVDKDYTQAATWFRKAAEQGDAKGEFYLGSAYKDGLGVEMDKDQTIYWLRLAADNKEYPEISSLASDTLNKIAKAKVSKK